MYSHSRQWQALWQVGSLSLCAVTLEQWPKSHSWYQARRKEMLSSIAPWQHAFESAGKVLGAYLRELRTLSQGRRDKLKQTTESI